MQIASHTASPKPKTTIHNTLMRKLTHTADSGCRTRRSAVLSRFGLQPAKKERAPEPNAWLKVLAPLKLYPKGGWDPAEEYWGEPGEPIEAWAKLIIKRGPGRYMRWDKFFPAVREPLLSLPRRINLS